MKFMRNAAVALIISLALASGEEVCDCSATCKIWGDPHFKGMWANNGNHLLHDKNILMFKHGNLEVSGVTGPGKTDAKLKATYLQRVKVGSKVHTAEQCKREGFAWPSTHILDDDASLAVTVKCSYPNKRKDYLHLDVQMTLKKKYCDNTASFKNWAKGKIQGQCVQHDGSGNGSKKCEEVVPTHKPTRKPTRKPRTPSPTTTKSPTRKPTRKPRTPSPTTTKSPTRMPTRKPRTKSPTLPNIDDNVVTTAPTAPNVHPAGHNATCTIQGDPHANCFKNDADWFQFYAQKENPYVVLYEMPGKLEAIGHIRSFTSPSTNESVSIVDKLLIKYGNTWQLQVGYESQCVAHLPYNGTDVLADLSNSTIMAPGHSEYSWVEEGLIISWKCAVEENGFPKGMTIVFNKQNPGNDQYKYEYEYNGGICAACTGAQAYTGKLPGEA